MKIQFLTHGGGTNWGIPNNHAAIRKSLQQNNIIGIETDLFMSSDAVIFPGNPYVEGREDFWGNSWLGLTQHPSNLKWQTLQKYKYDLQKATSELKGINDTTSTKIETISGNEKLASINNIRTTNLKKELHLHIEMPPTTNAQSQIKDMAKFLKEWLEQNQHLKGKIFIHSSNDNVLAAFRNINEFKLCLGIGNGNTDKISQLTDGLDNELKLISTSNLSNINDVIGFTKSKLAPKLPLVVFTPKSQPASEEENKVKQLKTSLRGGDYFMVNQGVKIQRYQTI